jgi:exopolysaccharide biosynthesis WecB/TagA/CpsF family protein
MSGTDTSFRHHLLGSDFILRDGVGVKILCEKTGIEPGLNLNGTDLIPELIGRYHRDTTVALMGTRDFALEPVRKKLLDDGFSRVDIIDGFQSDEAYLDFAMLTRPDLVILAMGMPKQERVAHLLRSELSDQGMLIVNGGAIIDFMSGQVKRAPEFMRRAGLEWLYRLVKDPRRLWKRNLLSVKFVSLVAIYKRELRSALNR